MEVGIAAEAGKPVIGYLDLDEKQREAFYANFEKDIMFSGAFTQLFDDLEEFAKFLLLM
ncbi:hypothetical protein MUP51_03210 [Candidatus Bathyarchaeota archaeon]|nr:hypothetical protein [Candidatus Bathyarchaeota archaeon]